MTRPLAKDELTRLGSQSGASEVEAHKRFGKTNWGLLCNQTPLVRCSIPALRYENRPPPYTIEEI